MTTQNLFVFEQYSIPDSYLQPCFPRFQFLSEPQKRRIYKFYFILISKYKIINTEKLHLRKRNQSSTFEGKHKLFLILKRNRRKKLYPKNAKIYNKNKFCNPIYYSIFLKLFYFIISY